MTNTNPTVSSADLANALVDVAITIERGRVAGGPINEAEKLFGKKMNDMMKNTHSDHPFMDGHVQFLASLGIDPEAPYAPPRLSAMALCVYNNVAVPAGFPQRELPEDLKALIANPVEA